MTAAPRRLDKIGNNSSAAPERTTAQQRYRDRKASQKAAAQLRPNEGVATCGKFGIREHPRHPHPGYVSVHVSEGRAGVGHVCHCHSVWDCPCCAAAIAACRQRNVLELLKVHNSAGGGVYMCTFTMKHELKLTYKEVSTAVSKAWGYVTSGRGWLAIKEERGFLEFIRAFETTDGKNGYHPHLHVLIFTERKLRSREQKAMSDTLFLRWARAPSLRPYGRPSARAWSFEEMSNLEATADYIVKGGASWEITHAHMKTGKRGGRGPFQMLADIVVRGDARDEARWIDYSKGSKGRRQLTVSRGLKQRYGIDVVNDRIEDDRKPEVIALISAEAYKAVVSRDLLDSLMDCAVYGGLYSICLFFSSLKGFTMAVVRAPPVEL